MRISDWSSDVCSSDLVVEGEQRAGVPHRRERRGCPATDLLGGRGLVAQLRVGRLEGAQLAEQLVVLGVGDDRCVLDVVALDRKSVVSGKSVSVRVTLGGRRIIKKKTFILDI